MDLLYSSSAIQDRVSDIASHLNSELKGSPVVHVIVMMNGSFIFAADLVRKLNLPVVLHFTGGSYFEGAIKREIGLREETLPSSFNNAPVVLVEDIIAEGKSINKLRQLLSDRQAKSISLASLLKRQGTDISPDHCAFTIPDEMFVVGYGLDLDGRYRELQDIYHLASAPAGSTTGVC